jgi:hypothetical protein
MPPYVNQGGAREGHVSCATLVAHGACNTMGNSSSTNKISAQDKYATPANVMECILTTQGDPGHEEPAR